MTCRNAATFAYDVYERFQKKVEAVAVVLDISDAKQCRLCNFFMFCLGECTSIINRKLVGWISDVLMNSWEAFPIGTWTPESIVYAQGCYRGLSCRLRCVTSTQQQWLRSSLGTQEGHSDLQIAYTYIYRTTADRQETYKDVFQEVLQSISQWYEDIGSKVNPAKTCVRWCSFNNSIGKADLANITLNQQTFQLGESKICRKSFRQNVYNSNTMWNTSSSSK